MYPVWGTEGSNPSPSATEKLKILGVDYGKKRVGLAVGDTELKIAVPKDVLRNDRRLLTRIEEIVRRGNFERIVVGLPLTPSGREGERAKEVKDFVSKLRERLPDLDIILWDERYTTQEALRRVSGKKDRSMVDAISAQIILEEYLQSL